MPSHYGGWAFLGFGLSICPFHIHTTTCYTTMFHSICSRKLEPGPWPLRGRVEGGNRAQGRPLGWLCRETANRGSAACRASEALLGASVD